MYNLTHDSSALAEKIDRRFKIQKLGVKTKLQVHAFQTQAGKGRDTKQNLRIHVL